MKANRRKRDFEKVVRINLTFPPKIIQALDGLVQAGGYKGPVEYFSAKVRRDARLDPEDQIAA